MHRLHEGTVFTPAAVPGCSLVEVIHREATILLPTDTYLVSASLTPESLCDNHCMHRGLPSIMTVNYIETYRTKTSEGILAYRELEDTEITLQRTLRTDVFEVHPSFAIEEYFDGTFLLFRLEKLADIGGYRLYSERNEHVDAHGSVYKVYPDRSCVSEYVVFAENFILRFASSTTREYPFSFRFWRAADTLYFVAKARDAEMQIECPDAVGEEPVRSSTSRGPLSIDVDKFVRRGGFVYVGMHRIGWSPMADC